MQQSVTITNSELLEAVQLFFDSKKMGLVADRIAWNSTYTGAHIECYSKPKPKTTVDYDTWVNPYAGTSLDR